MDHCAAPPRRASLCVKREGGRKGEKRRWGVPEKASKVVTPGINRFYQICISTIARYLRPRSLLQKSLPPFAWVLSTPSWDGIVAIALHEVSGRTERRDFPEIVLLEGEDSKEGKRSSSVQRGDERRGNKKPVRERLWLNTSSRRDGAVFHLRVGNGFFFFVFPSYSRNIECNLARRTLLLRVH